MNTLTAMIHSQWFDISLNEEDDFNIWLSVQMHQDFKNTNISRQELLNAYVANVYEMYKIENELDIIVESFPQS